MHVYGVDFTNAPSPEEPISCALCTLSQETLFLDGLVAFDSFSVFENFLSQPGAWIAGMDFPFGQPRRLIRNLQWPEEWEDYVGALGDLDVTRFEATLRHYRDRREPEDQRHQRKTDTLADVTPTSMLYDIPMDQMFFHGAQRLLRSGVGVLPCRPGDADRIVVEAHPALVSRKAIGRRSYKGFGPSRQNSARVDARWDLMGALTSDRLAPFYDVKVRVAPALVEELVDDPEANGLDALLAAVQAAWAWNRRGDNFGMPETVDNVEGWIVDPEMLRMASSAPATALN